MAKRKLGCPTTAVGYLRTSKDEQTLGPEAQRAQIVVWAAREGIAVVAWHVDHVTGAAPLDKRKALVDALDDVRRLGAGVLVVAKRDRLARDIVAGAMVERLAHEAGARVISAAGEGSAADDPSSVLMRRIVDAFAEHERLLIALRTRQALAAKRARGELTGKAPFGMRAGEDGKMLVPDEHEARVLDVVRALRAERATLRAITQELGARGLVGRTGKPYALAQVHRMTRGMTREMPGR